MDETKPKRRFRFGLRTLLVVVTLAAVGSWAYWIGWPLWQMHQEQARFINAVKQIRLGSTPRGAWTMISGNREQQPVRGYGGGNKGTTFGWLEYQWPNAMYLVAFELEDQSSGQLDDMKSQSVKLYRLPPAPAGYQPQTKRGQDALSDWKPNYALGKDWHCYLTDCVEFLSGGKTKAPGLQYELIYSDPPTKPVTK